MKSLTFATKLALILCLPLAAVALFGLRSSWEKWRTYQDYVRLEQNSAVLQQIGRTVHELQRERGRSAGFLTSKGTAFVEELRAQRAATDEQLGTLKTLLATFDATRFGPAFTAQLDSGVGALRQLETTRQAVSSLQLSGSDSAAFYTATIAQLLDVIVAMSHLSRDAEIANGISCYVNFLQGKEQAGIERATLTVVFTADAFTPETYRRFSSVTAAQTTFFRVFENFAITAQREFFTTRMTGPATDAVTRFREKAAASAATGRFGVSVAEWFDASTARIDRLKEVEDQLAVDYAHAADTIRQNAWREFLLLTVATALVIGITLAATGLIVRSLTRRLLIIADRLAEGADEVSSAATQVSAASQASASGASEQAAALEETAAALEETAASLEEIASMTRRNSEAAVEARTVSQRTHAVADVGTADMDDLRRSMDAIHSSAADVASVLKVIDEIAFQTNILALNAAVEAARAGEAGAGFAIVANEVRTLAQRSAQAARETAEKIETATRNSERGVASAQRASGHFTQIVDGTHTVDKLVTEIASASNEQSEGIQQVNRATAQMDQVTQSTAATAEETAAQAEHLNAQATELTAVVGELMVLVGGRRARDAHGAKSPARYGGRRRTDRTSARPVLSSA